EVLSRQELIEGFALERVGKSGSVFDAAKLQWMNAHYLHHASGGQLAAWGAPFLPERARALDRARLEALLHGVRGNLSTLRDLGRELAPFLDEPLAFEEDAAA